MKKYYSISLLFLSISGFTQSGPAGVGTSVNNVLWLKSDNGVYNDLGVTLAVTTNNVQQWNDNSGNSDNAIQNTAGNRPNYITGVLNSLPIIRYTAANADLLMSTTVGTGNAASVWAVASYSSLPSANPGILVAAPAGSGTNVAPGNKSIGMWVSSGAGTRVWGRGIQSNNTTRDISQVTTLSASTFYIINNLYNGVNSINQYVNNAAAGNIAYDGTLKSWSDVTIGRQGNETWNGDIAEIIMFNTFVNTAQKNIIDNYLSSKYNLALATANDFYSGDTPGNGNFDLWVAGIGQVDATNTHTAFDPSASQGLGITYRSGFNDGDFILTGQGLAVNNNIYTDISVVSGGPVVARWERIWYIDVTNTVTNILSDVVFDLSDGEFSGTPLTAANYVLLYRSVNAGNWTIAATGTSVVGDQITFANYSFASNANDGFYTIGTLNFTSTLPVELINFDVYQNNETVNIQWQTASELNNDYFVIERSIDGILFDDLMTVDGAGNSNHLIDYFETDFSPIHKTTYYRLRQVDYDGSITYSEIKIIKPYSTLLTELSLFPNPTDGAFHLVLAKSGEEEVLVVLRDLNGKEFYSKVIVTSTDKHIEAIDLTGDLPAGVYIITASSKNELYSQKLIVK